MILYFPYNIWEVSQSTLLYSAGLAVFDHAHNLLLPFFKGMVFPFMEFTVVAIFS